MTKFTSHDYIAGLVIISLVIFKLTGHNGTLDTAVAIIIGYYFARRQDSQVIIPKEKLNPPQPQELKGEKE